MMRANVDLIWYLVRVMVYLLGSAAFQYFAASVGALRLRVSGCMSVLVNYCRACALIFVVVVGCISLGLSLGGNILLW